MKFIYFIFIFISFYSLGQDYRTYSLVPPYDTADWAKHLNEVEKEATRITIKNNLLYKNGKPYSTTTQTSKAGIFVISENKELFISHQHDRHRFRHSSFLSGKNIISAGEIIVYKGVIKVVNNNSGHYLPAASSMYTFRNILSGSGYTRRFGTHPHDGVTLPLEEKYKSFNLKKFLAIDFCDFLLI